MPTLKQVHCSIELGPSNTKLKEYGARSSDGHVESFIAVPETDVPFSIRLQSEGYIAPGIAFFVFMDGEYQCNRNRIGLKLPREKIQSSEYETDFRVRQKEEKTSVGTFVVRDWTFAKLNKVSADKAPSLNPQFTHNVGTIEVVVLRCRSDTDEASPPRATRTKDAEKAPSVAKAKVAATPVPAPVPSVRSAGQQKSAVGDLGGLFGLFDGVYDEINIDGAGDERPVGPGGRVKAKPPPGMDWNHMVGTWVPEDRIKPPTDVDTLANVQRQVDAFNKQIAEMGAQVDGHGSRPNVVINQWGNRGRDDMRGDKYLGLQGQDRSAHKQFMREGGESVSSMSRDFPNIRQRMEADKPPKAAKPPPQPAPQAIYNSPPIHIPIAPNPREIADVLAQMRQKIEQDLEYAPKDQLRYAKRAFGMVTHLQGLLQQGGSTLARFPMWLTEALTDMEIRRQYMLRAMKKHPHIDLSDLEDQLHEQRGLAMLDRLLYKDYRANILEDCLAMSHMFAERAAILNEFVKKAESFSKIVSTDDLRARMNYVSMQKDKAREMAEQMMAQGQARNNEARPPPQQVGYGYGDAAGSWEAQQKGLNGGGNAHGWQQVGVDTWKSGQQQCHNRTWQDAEQKVDQPTNNWADNKPQSPHTNAAANGWGWQEPDTKSQKSGSKKTHEHDFRDQKTKDSDRWKQFQKEQSQQGSFQPDNGKTGWNDNKSQSRSSHNQGWGATAANDNAADNWGDKKSRAGSRSGSLRSSASARPQEPCEPSIKPYWKDRKKPYDRNEDSGDTATLKKHEEPREAYLYPASPLPALPDKEAKDASHGIQVSRGADYSHKCRAPVYIDTMDRPYAVFSFKYRSKEKLEKILKLKIDDVDIKKVQQQAEKDRLMALPKHKLIEELVNRRAPSKQESEAHGHGKNDSGWGKQDADSKAAAGWDNPDDCSRKSSVKGHGWGDDDKKSSHSQRSTSRQSNRKSQHGQTCSANGWGKGDGSKSDSKAGKNNGWDQGGGGNEGFGGW